MSIFPDTSSDEEETLDDVLRNRLVESVFDKTPNLFLPREVLGEIMTRSSVLTALNIGIPSDEDSELVKFILEDAQKIFATTIFIGVRPLRRAMHLFKSNHFNDEMLPIKGQSTTIATSHPLLAMENTVGTSKKRIWTQARILDFQDHQWKFQVPVFSTGTLSYDLGNQTIPFVKRMKQVREGAFGSLIPYTIHHDHILEPPGRTPLDVIAVKRISLDATSRQSRIEQWRSEAKAAATMDAMNDDHIVRFVAAFRRLESPCLVEHYLAFEWADGGDLADLWAAIPRPVLTPRLAIAFLRQLLGISRALSVSHELPSEAPFHGSVRPSRIYWFRQGDDLGTLKIGGWGKVPSDLAFQNAQHSEQTSQTSVKYFDRRYSAPEMSAIRIVPRLSKRTSRKTLRRLQANDMWALGCIAFECMIWLFDGNDGVRRFHRNNAVTLGSGSPFYQIRASDGCHSVEVHNAVVQTMERMTDKKSCDMDTKVLRNVLNIIKTGLLIVDKCPIHLEDAYEQRPCSLKLQTRLTSDKLVSKLELLNAAL